MYRHLYGGEEGNEEDRLSSKGPSSYSKERPSASTGNLHACPSPERQLQVLHVYARLHKYTGYLRIKMHRYTCTGTLHARIHQHRRRRTTKTAPQSDAGQQVSHFAGREEEQLRSSRLLHTCQPFLSTRRGTPFSHFLVLPLTLRFVYGVSEDRKPPDLRTSTTYTDDTIYPPLGTGCVVQKRPGQPAEQILETDLEETEKKKRSISDRDLPGGIGHVCRGEPNIPQTCAFVEMTDSLC